MTEVFRNFPQTLQARAGNFSPKLGHHHFHIISNSLFINQHIIRFLTMNYLNDC
jgi:hypothetical protein